MRAAACDGAGSRCDWRNDRGHIGGGASGSDGDLVESRNDRRQSGGRHDGSWNVPVSQACARTLQRESQSHGIPNGHSGKCDRQRRCHRTGRSPIGGRSIAGSNHGNRRPAAARHDERVEADSAVRRHAPDPSEPDRCVGYREDDPECRAEQSRRRWIGIVPSVRTHAARRRQPERIHDRRDGRGVGEQPQRALLRSVCVPGNELPAGRRLRRGVAGWCHLQSDHQDGHQRFPRRRHVCRREPRHGFAECLTRAAGPVTCRGSPAALQANPNIVPGSDIQHIYDSGFWLGGPIVRDKLWFLGAGHTQVLNQYILGSYNVDGTQVVDDNVMWNAVAKVSWQMSRASQLSFFHNLQYKLIRYRNDDATQFVETWARNYNYKYPSVTQAKWTHTLSSRMLMDVGGSVFYTPVDAFRPQPEVRQGDIARLDLVTNTITVARATYNNPEYFKGIIRGAFNFYAGPHELKAGYTYNNAYQDDRYDVVVQ